MNGDMGRCAEGAVCVVGAVGVGVRDLHGAQNDNQKDADQREENSPRAVGTIPLVFFTHTTQLYRRMRGWVEESV